ncbi:PREDICTED: protein NETWORKED 2A-like [Ipomoea nil]|uniref:protein NETWORKED 2A-like n=1 Tax=Ipomoea nil TaxID=35883 RepID=UPI000901FA79|nr:PREDICTED: protein NETWORKED 2A-like [Ipomoea nil]
MLQRGSTNSHSWLYASHIRTKQSKWLDQSLQDMEEKVQNMLRMIEHDGDSFAKRAEMYYKKRPELINSVEESYRAFRALAERFDNLSNQLHTANHTIATVCPEQIQKMAMEDDYDFDSPRFPKNLHLPLPANEPISPKPPKASKRDLKPIITIPSKPFQFKNKLPNGEDSVVVVSTPPSAKSGLTKQEAIEEIERLQKEICGLQTVKELVRSETGISKFQEIDKQIMELQQSVSRLQDEFGVGIDDKAARDLVAETALKSCQEILAKLQEEQEKCAKQAKDESQKIADESIKSEYLNEGDESQGEPGDAKKAETALKSCQESLAKLQEEQEKCAKEAKDESQKIADADRKLKSIKSEYLNDEEYQEDESQGSNQEPRDTKEGLLQQTFKEEQIDDDGNSKGNLTVTDLTIKIDELVDKVVTLEITLTSQTALIDTLRTESNDLHAQIQSLEDDKSSLTEDKHNLSNTVSKLEEELKKLKNLNQEVQNENSSLQLQLAEAISSADNLSENLKTAKPDNKIESMEPKEEDMENKTGEQKGEATKPEAKHVTFAEPRILESPTKQQNKDEEEKTELEKDEKFNWQKMLLNGVEDKERLLLKEYTTILRSYKDIKKQVEEMEKKDRDNQFEVALQISDLKTTIAKKDEEIQTLHQKLNLLPGLTEEEKLAMLNNSSSSNQKHVPDTISIDKPASISPVEANLRQKIDAVLDENLDFWLRFSTSYHQVPKFKTAVKDLQDEVIQATQANAKKTHKKFKSEIKPAYKQLIETHNELSSWLEQSQFLKDELQRRTWSLYRIQEDITQALRDGVEEDEIRFSSHQAAKFQGEILNMKQEHVKVREELQAGVDHIVSLQGEVEKVVKHLDQEYGFLMVDHPILLTSKTKTRVPLRTFIFGSNRKKQRRSVFSCIPSGKYEVLRDGSHP